MPKGLIHTAETKKKISRAAKRAAKQPNAGFRQRVNCPHCGQSMSPANLGRHKTVCVNSRGQFLNGKELSVLEQKRLRIALKQFHWTLPAYLAANQQQEGKCAICGNAEARRLSADHCHRTNETRQLLCSKCNFGLGMFNDSPDLLLTAARYIQRHTKRIASSQPAKAPKSPSI